MRAQPLLLPAALFVAASAHAAVRFVDASAPLGGNGSSWASAFRSPHQALAAALPGDEIRIAQGVYTPAPPGGDRAATFTLKTDVPIRGGFGGLASATPDLQDPAAFVTVLSGDLNGDDGPAFGNRGDNSRHIATLDLGSGVVLEFLGEATIDGVTFRAGEADGGSGLLDRGAALRAVAPKGAGLDAAALLTVTRCRFEGCRALRGGAVHSQDIVPTFTSCVFSGNQAVTGGGAEHLFFAFFAEPPLAVFRRCDFIGNEANGGGGFAQGGGSALLDSCRFVGNTADFGGGFLTPGGQDVTIVNCVFTGNHAISGSALFDDGSRTLRIANCTLSGNVATVEPLPGNGSIVESRAADAMTVRNCVVWGNQGVSPQLNSPFNDVAFSNVQDGASGPGNIATDPRFVNAAAGDFRLAPSSPCADAADSGAVPDGVSTDAAGRPRIVDDPLAPDAGLPAGGPIVDMGAFERQLCAGDATGDLAVNFSDLNLVLSRFGQSAPAGTLPGDVTGDGLVNFADLNLVLSRFGAAC